MVRDGHTNEEIYQHVQDEYGPDQIAIPRKGYVQRVSFGLPYLALGFMLLITYWLGWVWWMRGESRPQVSDEITEEEQETLDQITHGLDSPLKE